MRWDARARAPTSRAGDDRGHALDTPNVVHAPARARARSRARAPRPRQAKGAAASPSSHVDAGRQLEKQLETVDSASARTVHGGLDLDVLERSLGVGRVRLDATRGSRARAECEDAVRTERRRSRAPGRRIASAPRRPIAATAANPTNRGLPVRVTTQRWPDVLRAWSRDALEHVPHDVLGGHAAPTARGGARAGEPARGR